MPVPWRCGVNSTGMIDINGVEIKDGDVVRIEMEVFNSPKPIIKNCKVWYQPNRAAFMCDWDKESYLGGFNMEVTRFEVIESSEVAGRPKETYAEWREKI